MIYKLDPISQKALEFFKSSFISADESLGIPLLAEDERISFLWQSLKKALQATKKSQLLIVFINQRICDDERTLESNRKTLKFFSVAASERFSCTKRGKDSLLVVNGILPEFQFKASEGVGRARKVMADLALGLYRAGILKSEIHRQSDADVLLPENYFSTSLGNDRVAATYPYQHTQGELSEEEFEGLKVYERWLASYCEGLEQAASPYCYWALGSTLMFRLSAYEKIRGFPNVRAGEDFHFLAKLRKIGKIEKLQKPLLEIRGRHSTRVPFGTGRALENMKLDKKEYEPYPKKIFADLKIILKKIEGLSRDKDLERFFSSLDQNSQSFFEPYKKNFQSILAQGSQDEQKLKLLHENFDALATLRWVNARLKAEITAVPIEGAP